jgi:hypothetical protein
MPILLALGVIRWSPDGAVEIGSFAPRVRADANLVLVPIGAPIDSLVTYCDTAIGGVKYLLFLHTDDASGLPITPNGNDIPIRWPAGNKRIVFI